MDRGDISEAPIWEDVRTLEGEEFKGCIDLIYGGFPCQDISVAGRGKGLEGERSGLFFEIMRLAKEIKPSFLFLENVPAITSRGGLQVVREITEMGYDCRWCVISAASIGALHRRERWFLLAHSKHSGSHGTQERGSSEETIHYDKKGTDKTQQSQGSDQSRVLASESISDPMFTGGRKNLRAAHGNEGQNEEKHMQQFVSDDRGDVPNPSSIRCDEGTSERVHLEWSPSQYEKSSNNSSKILNYWQNTEPPVCGVAHGVSHRVDRIRGLGNAVVPSQAKEAFKILMGFK